jgi:hypothetical protein
MSKLRNWWWFHVRNYKVREGEKGGFKWVFRRFWLEITTLSGNFKARFTAGEHPYGYLVAGNDDDNINGFCETLYMVGMLLTTDQGFVNDIQKAIAKYDKRVQKENPVVEDEVEERIAIEDVKQVQEKAEEQTKKASLRKNNSGTTFEA